MFADPVCAWLPALCDPQGPARTLPGGLTPPQAIDLWRLAEEHGVVGAVSANWNRVVEREGIARLLPGHKDIPPAVAGARYAVRERLAELSALTLHLRARTRLVLKSLREKGLPVIVIKGEDFADRLYPSAGLRPFRDIALMLPFEAFRTAETLLPDLSFRPVQAIDVRAAAAASGESVWTHPGPPQTSLVPHWNLIRSPAQRRRCSVNFGDLTLEDRAVGGIREPRPNATSMLLTAVVHAALGRRFDRLQHLCDIRQICRGVAGKVDPAALLDVAARTGCLPSVVAGLEVTARLLPDPHAAELLVTLGKLSPRKLPSPAGRRLVGLGTLIRPHRPLSKLRRSLVRAWLKRIA